MKYAWAIRLFCMVTTLFWFSLYVYVPILPAYAQAQGATYMFVGIIIGAYGLSKLLFRIPVGMLSDHLSNRKAFVILGFAFSIISSAGIWFTSGACSLLFFRGLSGVAAATWVVCTVLFVNYFDREDTSLPISIINFYNNLGNVAAMFLGGLVAQYFSLKHTFIVASAAGIVGLLLSFIIKEKRPAIDMLAKHAARGSIINNKLLLLASGLALILQLLIFATVYGFTPLFAKSIGANNLQLSVLTILYVLPLALGSAFYGSAYIKKFPAPKILVTGFTVCASVCFMIPFVKHLSLLYCIQILGGFFSGIVFTQLMSLSIKNVHYQSMATAMGVFQAVYGFGMFIGPIFVGMVSHLFSLEWGLFSAGLFGLLGAALSYTYRLHLT